MRLKTFPDGASSQFGHKIRAPNQVALYVLCTLADSYVTTKSILIRAMGMANLL